MTRPDLSVTYLGLELRSPLVVGAAAPLSEDIDQLLRLEEAGAAAVVLHSLFEEQIERDQLELHRVTLQGADSYGEALSYFPEPSIFHVGHDLYLRHLEQARARLSVPVIASLNGAHPGQWVQAARRMEAAGASALELNGATFFERPPWKVDLLSYYTTVGDPSAEYFFTVELAADAGASLGGLTIQQSRGSDWQFPFLVERTKAFLGRPRQAGAQVPVTASFDSSSRRFSISFPEPIAPGSTVTVMLKPWHNPSQSDTYMFQVNAFPAGPNPSPAPLGFGTLRIYGLSDLL
jgi:hypothetical protein